MKKHSTIVIVLCTILNIYFFLPIATAYVTHRFSLEWIEKSGQMGDTFGGLLSPLIGLVSIYFIYKTFNAQREQLDDQRKANDAMITAQREQLRDQIDANRVTMGTLHLEKIEAIIEDTRQKSKNYLYMFESQPFYGRDCIGKLNEKYNGITECMYKYINNYDSDLISMVLLQAEQMSFVIELFVKLKRDMSEEYNLVAQNKIKVLVSDLIPTCSLVYNLLLREAKQIPTEDTDMSRTQKDNANWMIHVIRDFTEIFDKLVEVNFLKIGRIISVDSDEFWKRDPANPDPWNPIVDRESLKLIDVQRYYYI